MPAIFKHSIIRKFLPSTLLLCFFSALYFAPNAYSQEAEDAFIAQDALHGGEIKKGETLVSALKREGINGESIREATQSLSKIFDFRLSRSGDKFQYASTNNKRLTLLRYQRAKISYEARLVQGEYVSKVLAQNHKFNAPQDTVLPPAPSQLPIADEEPDTPRILDYNEEVDLDAPPQPIDPALAGLPSPDEEAFQPQDELDSLEGIEENENDFDFSNDKNAELGLNVEENIENEALARTPPPIQAQVQAQISAPTLTPPSPRKNAPIRYLNPLFISSMVLFLLALGLFALPRILFNKRMKNANLKLSAIIPITHKQQIASIDVSQKLTLIVAINPKQIIPLACIDKDHVAESEKEIKRKIFWNKMA
ncbi:MAG: hypothetical protein WC966_08305, partial [Bradymonadales bacterium]